MIIHPGIIGIDVSKAHFDIFDAESGRTERLPNCAEAARSLAERLQSRPDGLAVFEATGRYDRHLREAFKAMGIRYARVNPARARAFAKAAGVLAKTDAVDARMLAAMGQALQLQAEATSDDSRAALASLHQRRDQLVAIRAAERVRLSEAPDQKDSLESHIAWLDDEVARLDALITAAIAASKPLTEDARLMRSVPGIGPVAATTLLALMPELGSLSPKTVAALAGLAPFNADSGQFRGVRRIQGGRRRVRRALYMAAITAIRSTSSFKRFYEQLRTRGKPAKLALTAIARKLLVTLNAILRDRVAFQQ
jgi:transposase